MQLQLKIRGNTSGKTSIIDISEKDFQKNLLFFLQEKDFPIASSCRGEQVCKKCIINSEEILSCEFSVKEYLDEVGDTIYIEYL